MIDYHCHILPGLDDGARNLDESLEIARILCDTGFTEAYCTPHLIKGCFDNQKDAIIKAVSALQKELHEKNIHLTLHAGVEYYLDEFFSAHLKDPLVLGGSSYVLVEAPMQANLEFIKENIYSIVRRGYIPLLAHPERYDFLDFTVHNSPFTFHRDNFLNRMINRLTTGSTSTENGQASYNSGLLQNMGCKYQLNIGSIAGAYGDNARKRAVMFLQNGLCEKIGSDAHSSHDLKKRLSKGLKRIQQEIGREGLERLAN